MNSRSKLLAFLLGKKAAMLLKKTDRETVAPREVVERTGMPAGTVNPKLRELLSEDLMSQKDSGGCYVVCHQLSDVLRVLKEEKGASFRLR